MTIPEAAQLVLQAGAMGNGGEIFILDMGEPVSILDLAKETITMSGLRPFEDIDIVFTGLRAGEKLFEELDWANEPLTKTRHPKIFVGQIAPYPKEQVQTALIRLERVSAESGVRDVSIPQRFTSRSQFGIRNRVKSSYEEPVLLRQTVAICFVPGRV